MFKPSKKVLAAACTVVAVAGIGGFSWYHSAYADGQSTVPGSTDDPIVTKSYVDQKIAELQGGAAAVDTGAADKLAVVTVPVDKKLIVDDGGEVVVRVGKAIAYSADANGLSDLTDGVDIAPNQKVATNHLILFPRGGRGIQADPNQKNGLTVLVRGGYQLQDLSVPQ